MVVESCGTLGSDLHFVAASFALAQRAGVVLVIINDEPVTTVVASREEIELLIIDAATHLAQGVRLRRKSSMDSGTARGRLDIMARVYALRENGLTDAVPDAA